MQKLGEVIAEIKFPSSLYKGDKIAGTITLKNPFNENNVELLCEVKTWDGNYYAWYATVNIGQTYTFNFPKDFIIRVPVTAPDPIMPAEDVTLEIKATATGHLTEVSESATVTIKLSILQMKILGVPLWVWIAFSGAVAVAGTSLYIVKKKKFKT
jgi:hypothetical protein